MFGLSIAVSDGTENAFSGLKKKKKKPVELDTLSDENVDIGEDVDGKRLTFCLVHLVMNCNCVSTKYS